MRLTKLAFLVFFPLIFAACQPACQDPAGCLFVSSSHQLVLGVEQVSTGKFLLRNQELLRGIQTAIKSEETGSAKFRLAVQETTCTAPRSSQAVNRLLQTFNLAFIIGPACPKSAYFPTDFFTLAELSNIPVLFAGTPTPEPEIVAQILSRAFKPGPVITAYSLEDFDWATRLCAKLEEFDFSCLQPIDISEGSFVTTNQIKSAGAIIILITPVNSIESFAIPPTMQESTWVVFDPYSIITNSDSIPEGWYWLSADPTQLKVETTLLYSQQFNSAPESIDFYFGYSFTVNLNQIIERTTRNMPDGSNSVSRTELYLHVQKELQEAIIPLLLFKKVNQHLVLNEY